MPGYHRMEHGQPLPEEAKRLGFLDHQHISVLQPAKPPTSRRTSSASLEP